MRLWTLAWLLTQAPRQPSFPFRSELSIERAQSRRVRQAVRYAHRHVPYYRAVIDHRGLSARRFRSAADLAQLPLLERSDVQDGPERFTSTARPIEQYLTFQTGGTSAAPITVFHDRDSR